ncbi:MAG: ABC transporter ATP-binding protein [Candidatus Bathyarchaeia archaeon]|nr:ABC transporter ATP-binding protein [Candidatus Bathyarchaeota archaeon]
MEIVVKDLVKVYRVGALEIQALRGLSMKVEEGEMVAIIGPSGSGKTTLLNILGGLDRATAGYARVFNTEVTNLNPGELVEYRRRMVGHIFQTMNLIPTLTAAENIELPMIALGVPKPKRMRRVEELIDVIGLRERWNHKPGELSGGEQQRVAIAAALANDPPLILADEPTGELDTATARLVVDYLSRVNRELGKTVIMVTHDPAVARAAGRILRIQDGAIRADLEPLWPELATATTYADMLRRRINEVERQLIELEDELRRGELTGEQYVERQINLKRTLSVFKEELHRLGMVH